MSLSSSSRSYGGREHSLVSQVGLLLARGHGTKLLNRWLVCVTQEVRIVDAIADQDHVLRGVMVLSARGGGGV